jgi:hypothetical protein
MLCLSQTRDGAQAAKDNLNGKLIHEFEMHVGWGKAVPLPALPVYPPPDGVAAGRLLPPGVAPPAPLGGGFSAVPPVGSGFSAVPAPLEMMERPTDPAHVGSGPDIAVPVPEPRERFIIDTMADYVSVDGTDFEQVRIYRRLLIVALPSLVICTDCSPLFLIRKMHSLIIRGFPWRHDIISLLLLDVVSEPPCSFFRLFSLIPSFFLSTANTSRSKYDVAVKTAL